jgi:hypothetical protein
MFSAIILSQRLPYPVAVQCVHMGTCFVLRSIKVWFEHEDAWYHGKVISTVPAKYMNLGDTGPKLGYAEVQYIDMSTVSVANHSVPCS